MSSYQFLIDFIWFPSGCLWFAIDVLWICIDFPMISYAFLVISHGLPYDSQMRSYDFLMMCYGILLISYGFQCFPIGFIWFPIEFICVAGGFSYNFVTVLISYLLRVISYSVPRRALLSSCVCLPLNFQNGPWALKQQNIHSSLTLDTVFDDAQLGYKIRDISRLLPSCATPPEIMYPIYSIQAFWGRLFCFALVRHNRGAHRGRLPRMSWSASQAVQVGLTLNLKTTLALNLAPQKMVIPYITDVLGSLDLTMLATLIQFANL